MDFSYFCIQKYNYMSRRNRRYSQKYLCGRIIEGFYPLKNDLKASFYSSFLVYNLMPRISYDSCRTSYYQSIIPVIESLTVGEG